MALPSSFNPEAQIAKQEKKIVVALERISEAFRVLLWNESKESSLSPIQIQILIFLLFHRGDKCKVGYLATEFNMTKATISDSVSSLLKKNLIEKQVDEVDTRSFSILLTKEGKKMATRCSSFTSALENPLLDLTDKQKEVLLTSLLHVIKQLNNTGIISTQRMCFNCRFYTKKSTGHYCNFLQETLAETEIRIDCDEHEQL